MIIYPILPLWLIFIICAILGFIIIRNKTNVRRRLLVVILLFIINLRPMFKTEDVKITSSNLDVLFVADNTISMVAEDYNGSTPRLTAAKKDIEYIIDKFGRIKIFCNNF